MVGLVIVAALVGVGWQLLSTWFWWLGIFAIFFLISKVDSGIDLVIKIVRSLEHRERSPETVPAQSTWKPGGAVKKTPMFTIVGEDD